MVTILLKRSAFFAFASTVCLVAFIADGSADTVNGQGTFANPQILDNGNEVPSTISISESGIIEDITITIQGIEHTNVGDLIAELRLVGNGDTEGAGGEPAYLFFRPNVDVVNTLGSRSNLNGDYTFTTDPNDRNFWSESSIPDDETVDGQQPFFASDTNGDFHDLGGAEFFEGVEVTGDWQLVIRDANDFGNNEGSVSAWSIEFETAVAIPEPSAALLLLVSAAAFSVRRR